MYSNQSLVIDDMSGMVGSPLPHFIDEWARLREGIFPSFW